MRRLKYIATVMLGTSTVSCGSCQHDDAGTGQDAPTADDARIDAAGDGAVDAAGCTSHGAVDTSFGVGGVSGPVFGFMPGRAAVAAAVAIDTQQRIVVAGGFSSGARSCLVARFLNDGTLDPTFGASGLSRVSVGNSVCWHNAVALQADGKIVAGGSIDGHTSARAVVIRYLQDGNVDLGFGNNGVILADEGPQTVVMGIAIDAAQRIVVAEQFLNEQQNQSESYFVTRRYLPGGTLDITFGNAGTAEGAFANGLDAPYDLRIQTDGKIVVVGQTSTPAFEHQDFAVVRYTSEGVLDTSFATGGLADIPFDDASGGGAVAFDSLGRAVIAGVSGPHGAVVRLTNDGAVDSSFGTGGKLVELSISGLGYSAITVDSNDGILAVGTSGAPSVLQLARYTAFGATDSSFGSMGFGEPLPLTQWLQIGWDVATQADGRIVVVGEYGDLSTGDYLVARYCP